MTDNASVNLQTTEIGNGARRVVFLHGLFGRGKNFTAIARGLEPEFRSLLVDLPNHGRSGWTEGFDYLEMAQIVAEHLRDGFAAAGPVDVVGHSMGGKVAMVLALRHPELVRRLVVVDIAPVASGGTRGEFEHLLGALASLDLDSFARRSEADLALRQAVPQAGVRGFLLQNLARDGAGFRWEPHLAMLRAHLPAIMGWPEAELAGASFDGPALWLAGERSDYVRDEDGPAMRALFPHVLRMTVHGATHWVHADRPREVITALRMFLLKDR